MAFFKDLFSQSDEPNEFMTQFAQQLMMGGGSKGPIARLGNKLIGGLLHGDQTRAASNMREKARADRSIFSEQMMPTGRETLSQGAGAMMPGTAPGAGILAPSFDSVTGAAKQQQFGPEGVGPIDTPRMSPDEIGYMMKEKDPDVYGAMKTAWESDDPALQSMAMKYMENAMLQSGKSLDPKDYFFTTPQGMVVDRRKLNAGSGIEEAAVFNPIRDQKYLDTQKVGNDWVGIKMDGTPEVIYKGSADPKAKRTDIVWTDVEGQEYKQKGVLTDMDTGKEIKPVGFRTTPGAKHGTYTSPNAVKTQLESKQLIVDETLGRLNDMKALVDPASESFDQDIYDSFTYQGKGMHWWRVLKDKAGGLLGGMSPEESAKVTKLADWYADVERNAANMIKAMTGAAMTESEAKRLLKGIGNTEDSPAQFVGKLNAALDEFSILGDLYQQKLAEQGKAAADVWVVNEGNDIIKKHSQLEPPVK